MIPGPNAQAPTPLFDLDNKIDRLQIAFVVGSSAFGFMCFAALPLLSAWVIMTLAVTLGISLEKWTQSHLIPEPEAIVPDQTFKIFAATSILCAGLYFSFISVLPQILMGVIGCFALSTYFINQCVIQPQKNLNEALREAVTLHNIEHVRILLDRGADPFEPDALGNHCFHLAISNHGNTRVILQTLHQHAQQEKTTFKLVLSQVWLFQNLTLTNHFRAWYIALRPLFNNRTQDNRDRFFDATEALLNELAIPFYALLNRASTYIQQQIEHEPLIHRPNQAGSTPDALIDIVFYEHLPSEREELKQYVRDAGSLEEVHIDLPTPSPSVLPQASAYVSTYVGPDGTYVSPLLLAISNRLDEDAERRQTSLSPS